MINWHRLFGIALADFFRGSPYVVELEKDLSLKKQLLDVVILRRTTEVWDRPLPDGFDNLAEHNLISYKSFREPFDDWTVEELIAYYVNYRKQVSPALEDLLPKEMFRLFGISTRFPQKLSLETKFTQVLKGVYEVKWGATQIRLIVLSEIGDQKHNWLWELFSGVPKRVQAAATDVYQKHNEASTILNQLLKFYRAEGFPMPYTLEEFKKDARADLLSELTLEERLEGVPSEELLKYIPPEALLKHVAPEERLKGLTIQEIQAYLEKLLKESSSEPKNTGE